MILKNENVSVFFECTMVLQTLCTSGPYRLLVCDSICGFYQETSAGDALKMLLLNVE